MLGGKNVRKLVKNQSWRGPGGSLEALGGQYRKMRGALGFLRPSWGRLGGLLGRLGGLLGPSWRSWRPLGPSWARLGGRNRTPSRPNIDPKIDQNFDAFGDRLFGGFWWILLPKNGAKMPPKTSWKSMSISKSYFFKKKNSSFLGKNNDAGGSGSPT